MLGKTKVADHNKRDNITPQKTMNVVTTRVKDNPTR